jgi:hypothetical protein
MLAVTYSHATARVWVPIGNVRKLLELRAEIAHQLGYGPWADYQTEVRMAKNGAAAMNFERALTAGPPFTFVDDRARCWNSGVSRLGRVRKWRFGRLPRQAPNQRLGPLYEPEKLLAAGYDTAVRTLIGAPALFT